MLTGTLAAGALLSGENPDQTAVAEAIVSRQVNASGRLPEKPSLKLERLVRERGGVPVRDLFAGKTWYVPPPPPPSPAPVAKVVVQEAPRPVAPLVPFKFIGLMREEDGTETAYLAEHGQVIMVKKGDTLNDSYKVNSISPKQVELVYLPMDIYLTLAADGATGGMAALPSNGALPSGNSTLPPAAMMNTAGNYQ